MAPAARALVSSASPAKDSFSHSNSVSSLFKIVYFFYFPSQTGNSCFVCLSLF